ncbi:hypothetical protein BJX99DRAFT_218209 [Aspergillus californicus]
MPSAGTDNQDPFPAIDFQLRHDQATVDSVASSINRFGAFRVRNHGLSPTIISELFQTAKAFFASPLSVKMMDPFYLPFAAESVRGQIMRKETLEFDDVSDITGLPGPVTAFITEIFPILRNLCELLSTALCLDGSLNAHYSIDNAKPSLLYYPAGNDKVRNPAHQDYNAFTLIFQENDEAGKGLQIADLSSTAENMSAKVDETASFLPIDPRAGEFILMIGHSLSKWVRPNSPPGRPYITPCVHRVASAIDTEEGKGSTARYSLAHFVHFAAHTSLGKETVGDYVSRIKGSSRQTHQKALDIDLPCAGNILP